MDKREVEREGLEREMAGLESEGLEWGGGGGGGGVREGEEEASGGWGLEREREGLERERRGK